MQGTQYCSATAQTRTDTTTTGLQFIGSHCPNSIPLWVGRNFTPLFAICSPSRVAVTFPKQDVTPLGPGSSTCPTLSMCWKQLSPPVQPLLIIIPNHFTTKTFHRISHLFSSLPPCLKLKPKLVSPNPFFD